MICLVPIRFFVQVLCFVLAAQWMAMAQAKPPSAPPRKTRLLATAPYSTANTTRLLSLWEIPLAGGQLQFTPQLDGKIGAASAPNTAYALVDGTLDNPLAGNLVWLFKSAESIRPQNMAITSGTIAWHSGQQRAYVALSRSGASWERLQIYQVDIKQPLGSYSPASSGQDVHALDSISGNAKPFAEWKSDNLTNLDVFEVNEIQTFVEPESLLVHLVDGNMLKRINAPNPTKYKGVIDLRLRLKDGTWDKTE